MTKDSDWKIKGGKKLKGTIEIKGSKNGGVALICAALLNKGETTLNGITEIEEILRLREVLEAMGVKIEAKPNQLKIKPPSKYKKEGLLIDSVKKMRSGVMLIPAMSKDFNNFKLACPGGCKMGIRSLKAHVFALKELGIQIKEGKEFLEIQKTNKVSSKVLMSEMGDTATINAILAAANLPQKTKITFASSNYQVQEVCFFLEKLGIKIDGIGTSKLLIQGKQNINKDLEYTNSEDPIEAMFFIALCIVTNSNLTIKRVPIDFLELELFTLKNMGFKYELSKPYLSKNKKTNLIDIQIKESKLTALEEKIHAVPYPGINTDNLPFFVPIATQAKGRTLIHDWMWENRAIYLTELSKLGADITLYDPHKLSVKGITKLKGSKIVCPPALRPGAAILIAMLAAEGESMLFSTYTIKRGYFNIVENLRELGADISEIT